MASRFEYDRVKTTNSYTMKEFYEAIKDHPFTAGKPIFKNLGPSKFILFPPVNRNNQVRIMPGTLRGPHNEWHVCKTQALSVGNALKNSVLEDLTHGVAAAGMVAGKEAMRCSELVEITAKELESLEL